MDTKALLILLVVLFLGLPLVAWFAIKFKRRIATKTTRSLIESLLVAPMIVAIAYIISKVQGNVFVLHDSLRDSIIIWVGFSLVLWIWVTIFKRIKPSQLQDGIEHN